MYAVYGRLRVWKEREFGYGNERGYYRDFDRLLGRVAGLILLYDH